mgnify:CR=1 FL=1
MAYQLEKISPEDQEEIFKDLDCDERKKSHLVARGGHFNNQPGLRWAIDKGNDSYFFIAPKLDVGCAKNEYFFYFKGIFYRVSVFFAFNREVCFDDIAPAGFLFEELKKGLFAAFEIHRFRGVGSEREPPFLAGF